MTLKTWYVLSARLLHLILRRLDPICCRTLFMYVLGVVFPFLYPNSITWLSRFLNVTNEVWSFIPTHGRLICCHYIVVLVHGHFRCFATLVPCQSWTSVNAYHTWWKNRPKKFEPYFIDYSSDRLQICKMQCLLPDKNNSRNSETHARTKSHAAVVMTFEPSILVIFSLKFSRLLTQKAMFSGQWSIKQG